MSKPSPTELFLSHHGVKGMQWGVRRQAKQNGKAFANEIKARQIAAVNSPLTKSDYRKLGSSDVRISGKNATFKRIAGSSSKKLSDSTYVSTNATDHTRYTAALMPNGGTSRHKYSLDVHVNDAVISPSKKARVDTFIELLDTPVTSMNKRTVVKGRDYFGLTKEDSAKSSFELGLKYYNTFVQTQVYKTPLHTEYFKRIQAKGYNALIDDADKGIFSDTPVLLFTSKVGATVTNAKRLSKKDILNAQLNVNRNLGPGR